MFKAGKRVEILNHGCANEFGKLVKAIDLPGYWLVRYDAINPRTRRHVRLGVHESSMRVISNK